MVIRSKGGPGKNYNDSLETGIGSQAHRNGPSAVPGVWTTAMGAQGLWTVAKTYSQVVCNGRDPGA